MKINKLLTISRFILGVLFIYAGARKIIEPTDFADAIAGFKILPSNLIHPVALGLPIFETVLGCLVMLPMKMAWQYIKMASLGLILLNVVFIVILLSAWLRGLSVECGCFGFGLFPPSTWDLQIAIARDIVFLAMAYCLYVNLSDKGLRAIRSNY